MDTQRAFSATVPVVGDELLVGDRSTARAFREARMFLRLTRLIATAASVDELLGQVFELLRDVIPADRMAVVQCDASECVRAQIYPERGAAPEREIAFVKNVAQRVLSKTLASQAPEQTFLDQNAVKLNQAPEYVRGVLAAPLVSQGNVTGAFIVELHRSDSSFSDQDEQIVAAVAQQIVIVLEREQAFEEARRRSDQLAAFTAVASTVNEWVNVEQLAHRFLPVFLNTTRADYGLFYLLEKDDELALVGHFGIPPELVEFFKLGHLSRNPHFRNVVEQGRLALIQDVGGADVSPEVLHLTQIVPAQALLLLPLRVKGRAIGMIALGKAQGHLELTDREFVQSLGDQVAQAIENARLFAESERRFQEQSALRDLAQRFLSAVTPDEVLERTLDTLAVLLPGDFYEILLPNNEGAFVLVNGRGWRRGIVGRTRTMSDPHLHAGYALRTQSPVIIENFASETRFQPSDYLMRHQVVSGICAPMLAEMRMIGLLGVYSRAARQFSEEQSHFLYLVATQTAMALEKARHSQAAARRLDELILLNDVIVAANSQVSLEHVLDSVTSEIGELLQSSDVHVTFVANDEQERLPLVTYAGNDSRWGNAVAEWVTRNRQPLLLQDLMRDSRFSGITESARACLGAPIPIGERVIGVIAVAHPEPNTYDANDLRLLTTLAGQIAAAIERARLLDETGKRLAEISAMFEFSNALRTATSEAHLIDLVVRDAVSMLQANGGSLQLVTPDLEHLRVAAVRNMRHLGLEFPRDIGGLSWDAFASGESYAVADLQSDPRVSLPQVFDTMRAGIVAPLRTPSGVLGTLFVGFNDVGAANQDRVRLATTIANLAAQSLQRMRLDEQTIEQAQSLTVALEDLEESYQATLLALSAALDARDRETEGHSQRVTKWALAIGRQLNLPPEELTNLERGALLHDVGKIGISDNILLKAGPLTPEERVVMNQHPRLGYEMLKAIPFLQPALPVVLYHQEMYDGSGYPMGLRGEEIPLCARIFAVADTYDAMTSTRPYRFALSHEQALAEIIAHSGSQFDPQVVAAFLKLFEG